MLLFGVCCDGLENRALNDLVLDSTWSSGLSSFLFTSLLDGSGRLLHSLSLFLLLKQGNQSRKFCGIVNLKNI